MQATFSDVWGVLGQITPKLLANTKKLLAIAKKLLAATKKLVASAKTPFVTPKRENYDEQRRRRAIRQRFCPETRELRRKTATNAHSLGGPGTQAVGTQAQPGPSAWEGRPQRTTAMSSHHVGNYRIWKDSKRPHTQRVSQKMWGPVIAVFLSGRWDPSEARAVGHSRIPPYRGPTNYER